MLNIEILKLINYKEAYVETYALSNNQDWIIMCALKGPMFLRSLGLSAQEIYRAYLNVRDVSMVAQRVYYITQPNYLKLDHWVWAKFDH